MSTRCHLVGKHPELSGCITTLTVCNTGCKLCAAMDTLIDQDGWQVTATEMLISQYEISKWLVTIC